MEVGKFSPWPRRGVKQEGPGGEGPHLLLRVAPRDLDHPNFEWTFQRQLYDCLHDYLVEMFVRTPQDKTIGNL